MSEIEELKKSVSSVEEQFAKVESEIDRMREKLKSDFEGLLDKHQSGQVDKEFLSEFIKEPFVMLPKRGHEWYVIVPKFMKMQVGYLEHSTKSYNIFIVNKYVQWLSEIPSSIKDKLKFPTPYPFKVYDGMLLTGEQHQKQAWDRFKNYLHARVGKDRIRIRKGYEFKLIAKLIEEGTLPFIPKEVAEDDRRDWSGVGYDKYAAICNKKNITGLQDKAWLKFLEHGAMGIYWAFGGGKSLFGHRLCGCITGNKLVVVPTITLKEQWFERLELFNPLTNHEVQVETYHSYSKVKEKDWKLVIFDECQHLPANTFIRLSTLKTKYRIGFSGSPFREDGRENYIFALTGYPMGIAWEDLLRLKAVRAPQFRLYVFDSKREKDQKLEELLQIPIKTIVFCDSLDYGEQISKKFEIPFVYSATKDRLDIIRNSLISVVSRVGDQGISILDLERVIEVAFLYGSRMQESQRFGRLMHSSKKAQHIILMTRKEFEKYQKRLKAILQRGFKIEYVGV